jgi:predicted nucleic acid-binding protein
MSYLLDTNILSAYLRRPAGLAHRFTQYSGRRYTTSLALAELFVWAYNRQDPSDAITQATVIESHGQPPAEYGYSEEDLDDDW